MTTQPKQPAAKQPVKRAVSRAQLDKLVREHFASLNYWALIQANAQKEVRQRKEESADRLAKAQAESEKIFTRIKDDLARIKKIAEKHELFYDSYSTVNEKFTLLSSNTAANQQSAYQKAVEIGAKLQKEARVEVALGELTAESGRELLNNLPTAADIVEQAYEAMRQV